MQQIVLGDLRHLADSLRFPLAVLVSSQDLAAIEEVSDQLLILTKGQMTFFSPIEDIGRDRRVNRFEMSGRHVELTDLEELFADIDYRSLSYNGLAFVPTTSERRHTGNGPRPVERVAAAHHVLPGHQPLGEERTAE